MREDKGKRMRRKAREGEKKYEPAIPQVITTTLLPSPFRVLMALCTCGGMGYSVLCSGEEEEGCGFGFGFEVED